MKKSLKAEPSITGLSRRLLFGGAGTAGALAAAAVLLPKSVSPVASTPSATAALPGGTAAGDGGYQLTEHVQRYYQTARV